MHPVLTEKFRSSRIQPPQTTERTEERHSRKLKSPGSVDLNPELKDSTLNAARWPAVLLHPPRVRVRLFVRQYLKFRTFATACAYILHRCSRTSFSVAIVAILGTPSPSEAKKTLASHAASYRIGRLQLSSRRILSFSMSVVLSQSDHPDCHERRYELPISPLLD